MPLTLLRPARAFPTPGGGLAVAEVALPAGVAEDLPDVTRRFREAGRTAIGRALSRDPLEFLERSRQESGQ